MDAKPYKPMLAKTAEDLLALSRARLHMEPKLDGDRAILVKKGPEVAVLTRSGRDVSDLVPAIVRAAALCPHDFALDGEVGVVGHWIRFKGRSVPVIDFGATRSVMGSSAGEALAKQRRGRPVTFFAFDCLEMDDRNLRPLPEGVRRAFASTLASWFNAAGFSDLVRDLPRWHAWTPADVQALVALGAEGAMLKNPHASYQPGRRPQGTWYKAKRRDTVDAVVTGFEPGRGKYAGQIGAIRFRYGGKAGTASGMDEATRADMTARPEAWVGRVIEVAYTGSVGEGLRHPRYIRVRDDKRAEECV